MLLAPEHVSGKGGFGTVIFLVSTFIHFGQEKVLITQVTRKRFDIL